MNKKIHIIGGGTINHVRNHLALAAPAYGQTARQLADLFRYNSACGMDVVTHLTRMAGGPTLETNNDIEELVDKLIEDKMTKVIIMTAALCDFNGTVDLSTDENGEPYFVKDAELKENGLKYGKRLDSRSSYSMILSPAGKIIKKIRATRKDIFAIGFKTVADRGLSTDVANGQEVRTELYKRGLTLLKQNSLNLVVVNDVIGRFNMIVVPEEARYAESLDRTYVLKTLVDMTLARCQLTFTRSTVVDGQPVPWESAEVPAALRSVVSWLVSQGAYRDVVSSGGTVGHFACKLSDTEFLTSIRRSNFNDIERLGMVRIKTDGPDTVLAYGAKPSVGGQSQRIVFKMRPSTDCIVHFHCPLKTGSLVPTVSQKEFECGSHECGSNTANGLLSFANSGIRDYLYAVYLDNHGPNIVFSKKTDPEFVIQFIKDNFDLTRKTGGY